MKRKLLAALLVFAFVMPFAACNGEETDPDQSSATFPMTYTDSYGNTVTIEEQPEKIVSIAPNVTEILYAIGAGDKIVGNCLYCDYPEDAATVTKVGDMINVNAEMILELEADIVFVSGESIYESLAQLTQIGIPVVSYNYEDIDAMYQCITDLGNITGQTAQASELVGRLQTDYAALLDKVSGVEKRKVFIDLWGFFSSNKDFFLGENLNAIAVNIAYDQPNAELPVEFIIEQNPDVYISMEPEESFNSRKPPGFDEIEAFKNGEVYFIDTMAPESGAITRPGPRFVEGLTIIYDFLYPPQGN